MYKILSLVFVIKLSVLSLYADPINFNEDSLLIKKGINARILPIVYYLPETSLAFGAAGVSTFRISEKQTRASVIQFAGLYTLKNQCTLTTGFDIFAKGEDLRFIGELSYYNYFYNFYGIGKETQKDNFERYQVTFPRLRIAGYRKVKDQISVGLLHQFEGITSINYEKGGLIDKSNYTGKDGGVISSLGIGFLYDSRDNIISPLKGFFTEFQYSKSNKIFLSAFNYHRSSLDVRHFITPFKSFTVASNIVIGHMAGNVPFYDMYSIGSSNEARGINDRRFKDKTLMVGQVEVRFPVCWRLRANVFASSASVGNGISSTIQNRFTKSYGAGLRYVLNKNDKSLLRVDVARSKEGFNFYFTAGEAF